MTSCVASWILSITHGSKVGGYLSDISGAFDKVFKLFMMAKLFRAGVGDNYLRFLFAYLEPRKGQVAVEGELSDTFDLENMVFQGTVLGPTLWNLFFSDVAEAATRFGGTEAMFADDLSMFKSFDRLTDNLAIKNDLSATLNEVHAWGIRNRVSLNVAKE